jgi:hypothetical protein
MPLRDHFRPPLDDLTSWEGLHTGWPMVIVQKLVRRLPRRYVAFPGAHSGATVELDVATFEKDDAGPSLPDTGNRNGGGVATAVWAPSTPTLSVVTDLPQQDAFEVRVYDTRHGRRLVAVVEIVSPANKDRPEHRRIFAARCVGLLQNLVSVTIVDLVTTRNFNLYGELLEMLGQSDPSLMPEPPSLYAVACRTTRKQTAKQDEPWLLETWMHPLTLGQALPTLPLWVADNLPLPLELEESYEEACQALRIP